MKWKAALEDFIKRNANENVSDKINEFNVGPTIAKNMHLPVGFNLIIQKSLVMIFCHLKIFFSKTFGMSNHSISS